MDRIAGLFVVLFAKPVSQVASLQLGDIDEVVGSSFFVSFGPDPVELPEPVAANLTEYLGS